MSPNPIKVLPELLLINFEPFFQFLVLLVGLIGQTFQLLDSISQLFVLVYRLGQSQLQVHNFFLFLAIEIVVVGEGHGTHGFFFENVVVFSVTHVFSINLAVEKYISFISFC